MTREEMKPIFKKYKQDGGIITPMNTESCRKYLATQLQQDVTPEDVLWLFYHEKN